MSGLVSEIRVGQGRSCWTGNGKLLLQVANIQGHAKTLRVFCWSAFSDSCARYYRNGISKNSPGGFTRLVIIPIIAAVNAFAAIGGWGCGRSGALYVLGYPYCQRKPCLRKAFVQG